VPQDTCLSWRNKVWSIAILLWRKRFMGGNPVVFIYGISIFVPSGP
jgi:hypothetical protein